MTKTRFVSDLEISQTADQLVIRGRRKTIVVSIVLACVCVPFGLAIAYKNIVGTADVPAIWARKGGDLVGAVLILLVMVLPWAIVPPLACAALLRKRRRAWMFDRQRGELTRLGDRWALADSTAVAVEVRRGRFTWGSAWVVLHFGDAKTVVVARFSEGKHYSLQSRISEATDLANAIGGFLRLPVREPPPANRGFEVVMPNLPADGR